MPDPVSLSWSTAEVENAKLTVALEGEVPKGWKQSFERTVQLLGSGEWGEIQLKKGKVEVKDVAPGNEDKLRFHLEAIVTQANADTEPDEPDPESDEDDEAEQGPDAEMTGRFRSFDPGEDADEDQGQDSEKRG
jgi:hypothetical protein